MGNTEEFKYYAYMPQRQKIGYDLKHGVNRLIGWVWKTLLKHKYIEPVYTVKSQVEQRTLDVNDLANSVLSMMDQYTMVTGETPNKIIIGRDLQIKLFGQVTEQVQGYSLDQPGTTRMFMGMVLETSPFFDGIVLTHDKGL